MPIRLDAEAVLLADKELSAAGHTACRSSLGPAARLAIAAGRWANIGTDRSVWKQWHRQAKEHFRTSADVSEVVTIAQNLSLNRRPKRTQKLVVPRAGEKQLQSSLLICLALPAELSSEPPSMISVLEATCRLFKQFR